MTGFVGFIRKAVLFAIMIALLVTPSFFALAKGKGFKDVVKHIEKNYGAKKVRIPFLGLANFAIKLVRPAGVKGFKLAVFEDRNFSDRLKDGPGVASFDAVMREAYNEDWQPMVQVSSKRNGASHTFIYVNSSGKDVQFALAVLEDREAVVLEVKFNPDAAARFLENPKIMGVSLGKSIRGDNSRAAAPNRPPRRASDSSGDALIVDSTPVAPSGGDGSTDERMGRGVEGEPENPSLPPSFAPTPGAIRIETRLVNLNVKAMDKAGRPLTDLKVEDFVVSEDGVKQDVSHFKPVSAPVNVIMLMDLSGSVKPKRKAMIAAARKFIDALPAQDKIALVAFTRKYRALSNFTTDKESLKQVVERIKGVEGGTAFYDSMWQAMDDLDKVGDARKAIVVLTDGEDESLIGEEETTHTFDELLDRASEEDVTIYPIYFSANNHYDKIGLLFGGGGGLTGAGDNRRTARKQLDLLAEQTGGEVFSAQREEDLEDAYKRVAAELHTLYSLAYLPDDLKRDGRFRRIDVKLNREGAVAKTRRGYYDK
ncbi:MAG TPA: VWA domain-containing protein [Blastocatellia bacterium]